MRDCAGSPGVGSARSLYRLGLALATVALSALVLATGLALTSVELRAPGLGALAAACQAAVIPNLSWPALAVALLGSLSFATFALGVSSVARQGIQQRRHLRRLAVVDSLEIDGATVSLLDDERPQAFCAHPLRPRIYLSTGALIALSDEELRAVLAHERHHQRRRDPLRLLVASALGDALFFLPVLRRLRQRYAELAEIAADDAALGATGDRSILAAALLTFGEQSNGQLVVGIAPERVDHLLGHRARWELPTKLVIGALVTLGGLVAIGAAVASASTGAPMSVPFVLTQLCAVAMTLLPAIFGALLLIAATRRVRARRTSVVWSLH